MTKKPETRLWACEFGAGYAVPEAIDVLVESGELTDNSWHNDVAPSFIRRDGLNLWTLWVDHPEKDNREFPEHNYRYAVYHCLSKYSYPASDGTEERTCYTGDDLEKALSAILNTNGTYPAKNDTTDPTADDPTEAEMGHIAQLIVERKHPEISEAYGEFIGGGTVVQIKRNDDTAFSWGTANENWGADVFFPWNEDGDIDDSAEIPLRTGTKNLDEVATKILEATLDYVTPPRPDSPAWYDAIGRKVQALGGDRLKVETYHSGGGIYGVAVTRTVDGAWLFWGSANDTWGADAHPSYDSDFSGDISTELPTSTKDLDAVAAVIVSNTLQYDLSKVREAQDEVRLEDAMDGAEQAFWDHVFQKHYPEATSGDLDPLVVHNLRRTMKQAIALWVRANVPQK